jgi:hypothetical protein
MKASELFLRLQPEAEKQPRSFIREAGKVSVNPVRDVRHRREDNSRVRFLNQFEPLPTEVH